MDKRQFILDTLLPYFADPSTCALSEDGTCVYLLDDGRQCAAGKHLRPEFLSYSGSIRSLTEELGDDVFTKEATEADLHIGVWEEIQDIHDHVAKRHEHAARIAIDRLEDALFGIPQTEVNELGAELRTALSELSASGYFDIKPFEA